MVRLIFRCVWSVKVNGRVSQGGFTDGTTEFNIRYTRLVSISDDGQSGYMGYLSGR